MGDDRQLMLQLKLQIQAQNVIKNKNGSKLNQMGEKLNNY